MKICYLANSRSIHTQRWIKYFADKGNDVHLISFESAKEPSDLQVCILKETNRAIQFAFRPLALLIDSIKVNNIINKIKPDVLHAHYVSSYGIIGAITNFHPLILSAWGSDVLMDPQRSKILNMLVKFALKKADIITCDGDNLKDAIIQLGVDPKKIELVFHGVDTNKFNTNKRDPELRKIISQAEFPIIISFRNLEPIYNVESFIKSIPLILQEIPNVRFIIIGDGSEKERLKSLVNSLKIDNMISFIGHVPHNLIPKYLASSDIYVSTSLSDGGIAVSTMEAMACGVPIVATDVGDIRKWIKDGKNGFIIPKENPKAIAEKVIFLCKNSEIMKKFSSINIKLIEKNANYNKEMEKVDNIYTQVVSERNL
jgi:L-malate glycosyltransferase